MRCAPLLRADPRSKLAAGLLEALKARAAEQGGRAGGAGGVEGAQGRRALGAGGCRLGGAKRVKVETVERLCRKVLGTDPRSLYGEGFDQAWQHGASGSTSGCRPSTTASARPRACRCWPPAAAPRSAGCWPRRAEALQVAIGYLERHGLGVRRDHNGTDRYQATGGWWRWPSSTA